MKYYLSIIGLVMVGVLNSNTAYSQVNIQNQLDQASYGFSTYVDGYLYDLTSHMGFAYLASQSTSGKIRDQWELGLTLTMGVIGPRTQEIYVSSDNISTDGNIPALFGTDADPGHLIFSFIDEGTNTRIVDPYTGDLIGFSFPVFPGLGTPMGAAPSLFPIFSLGIGYGTEVSFGVTGGLLKAFTKDLSSDFSLTNNFNTSIGLKHDAFYWIPALHEKNYHLTLGVNYGLLSLGAEIGPGVFEDLNTPSADILYIDNNLTGLNYSTSTMGVEVMASKKLAFIDLSIFGAYGSSRSQIQNVGSIDIHVANTFYADNNDGFTTYSVDHLINVDRTVAKFLYGAAIQFNLGPVYLGLKYADAGGSYLAMNLGFRILKGKK